MTPILSTFSLIICFITLSLSDGSRNRRDHESTPLPSFLNKIPSLSVLRGNEARMECIVHNLGDYEVSWIFVDKQTLISTQDAIRIGDDRFKVRRDNNTFWLIIQQVTLDDIGYYACRINSRPPKSQVGFLDVLVAPYFVDDYNGTEVEEGEPGNSRLGDSTVIVNEHRNVSLSCRAVSNPRPTIKWIREDGHPIFSSSREGEIGVADVTGETIVLQEVTRWSGGTYTCTVSNGVSSTISRRIMLLVQFPPMITIPSQVVTVGMGQNTVLECVTESQPLGHQQWLDPKGRRMSSKKESKYVMVEEKTYHFKVIYKLFIFNLHNTDSGRYTCLIKNPLGVTKSGVTVNVVENWKSTTTTSTTSTMSPWLAHSHTTAFPWTRPHLGSLAKMQQGNLSILLPRPVKGSSSSSDLTATYRISTSTLMPPSTRNLFSLSSSSDTILPSFLPIITLLCMLSLVIAIIQ